MSATVDILKLAEALKEAQDLVARQASLEQACAESEKRLASLRAAEAVVSKSVAAAEVRAAEIFARAEAGAREMRAAAERDCAAKRAACEERCAEALRVNQEAVALLEDKQDGAAARGALLEAEETRLAQSVTALKAELDSLRAKFS